MKKAAMCFCFVFLVALGTVQACTAFQLIAQDGASIYCRSMEFAFQLESELLIVPRGIDYVGTAPGKKEGLKWKTTYGYVGMNQNFAPTLISDGLNEKGLVASVLYLPGFAQYEAPDSSKSGATLGAWELISYLLATCSSVDEVKGALPNVIVAEQPLPMKKNFELPVHFYVSDASGKVIIIEYVAGKRHVYDNPLGVLTNSPPFDWHLKNLSNFVNLSPTNATSLTLGDVTIKSLGQGSGALGLPGDYTPPSRFVKAALFASWAKMPKDGLAAVRTGFHILNAFDIFEGVIRTSASKEKNVESDITQWTIVHDKTNLKTYFRSYESLAIQMIDLNKIDFTTGGFQTIPLAKEFTVIEVTASAKAAIDSNR